MTLTLAGIASDAWTRWRRDRAVLVALAGPFVFLPLFAWLLLVPEPIIPASATSDQKVELLLQWMSANLHWVAARVGVTMFGGATILVLYLSRQHRTVGETLRQTLTLLPFFLVAVVASWGLVTLGFFAFIVPALYIYGRVALTGPAIVAEPDLGISGAIMRSIALTRGHGWLVFAYLALTVLAAMLAVQLLDGVERAIFGVARGNAIATLLFGALAAAAVTATTLARLLFEVALYRRLSRPRHRV